MARGAFDACRAYQLDESACAALAGLGPAEFQNMLSAGGYPLLRDRRCENGRCLTHLFRNECEICADDECRRICREKKSNTKELLEFLKEVVASRYRHHGLEQIEIIPGAEMRPQVVTVTERDPVIKIVTEGPPPRPATEAPAPKTVTETPPPKTVTEAPPVLPPPVGPGPVDPHAPDGHCARHPCPGAPPAPAVTVTMSEIKTTTVYKDGTQSQPQSSQPTPAPSSQPAPGPEMPAGGTAPKPCTDPLSRAPECVRVVKMLEMKIKDTVQKTINSAIGQRRARCDPQAGKPCEGDEPAKSTQKRGRKSKRRMCKELHCSSGDRDSDEDTRGRDEGAGDEEGGKSGRGGKKEPKSTQGGTEDSGPITLTRIVKKTVTVETPITLYREYTTTVTKEKPIINYKVTTVTEVSTLTPTRTVTVGPEQPPRGEDRSKSKKSVTQNTNTASNEVNLVEKGGEPASAPQGAAAGCGSKDCGGQSGGTIEEMLKKCHDLKECKDKLMEIYKPEQKPEGGPKEHAPATTVTVTAQAPAAAEPPRQTTTATEAPKQIATVTEAPQQTTTAKPRVIYRTETVRKTVTTTEEPRETERPRKRKRPARTTASADMPPEAHVTRTKTVEVPVYKTRTVTEGGDVETVYKTVTKRARAPAGGAGTTRDDSAPQAKRPKISFRCNVNMTNCKRVEGGGAVNRAVRTITNTIYSIQRAAGGSGRTEHVTTIHIGE